MTVSVLMYHALYLDDSELAEIAEEDRPYAISCDMFQKQLDLLIDNNIEVLDPLTLLNDSGTGDKHSVLLTFDDGHESFYRYAFPELKKRSMQGIFFVTSELIKQREDFCTWLQLKEMTEHGMSIQSHGKTHKFISDLDSDEAREELAVSRNEIEKELGVSVNSISFPGGRYTKREIKHGIELGYDLFFTSNEGVNEFISGSGCNIIKRLALKKSTNLKEYLSLSKGNFFLIKKRIVIYKLKFLIKKLLGNSLYHVLYKRGQTH